MFVPSVANITEEAKTANASAPDNSLIANVSIRDWHDHNFAVKLEVEKLAWMRDIPYDGKKMQAGEMYEARFDWKGILMPYHVSESDGNRELFLHSDDAQRPGYTLQELFRLARLVVVGVIRIDTGSNLFELYMFTDRT